MKNVTGTISPILFVEILEPVRASGKMHSRLFVQGNCPIQNCANARLALKAVGAKLFAVPREVVTF